MHNIALPHDMSLLLLLREQAGELERVEKEINLSLQGIGLSLVNDKQHREIAYMAIGRLAAVIRDSYILFTYMCMEACILSSVFFK